jgi:hypothetical protein
MKHAHKVGRPSRASTSTTSNVTVRLTQDERDALESHVEKRGEPMAALIRAAMDKDGLFTPVKKRGG